MKSKTTPLQKMLPFFERRGFLHAWISIMCTQISNLNFGQSSKAYVFIFNAFYMGCEKRDLLPLCVLGDQQKLSCFSWKSVALWLLSSKANQIKLGFTRKALFTSSIVWNMATDGVEYCNIAKLLTRALFPFLMTSPVSYIWQGMWMSSTRTLNIIFLLKKTLKLLLL